MHGESRYRCEGFGIVSFAKHWRLVVLVGLALCASGCASDSEPVAVTVPLLSAEIETTPDIESSLEAPEVAADPAVMPAPERPVAIEGPAFVGMNSQLWQSFTGLTGTQEEAWVERVQRACDAPIWERSPAEALAAELIRSDGGDPEDFSPLMQDTTLLDAGVWVLWRLAYSSPQGCPEAFPFPPLASTVLTWNNMTGLLGMTALAEWRTMLDRVCAVTPFGGPEAEQIATEFVTAVGAAVEPGTVMNAVTALQVIVRQPGICP